jgi:hypothetical protein
MNVEDIVWDEDGEVHWEQRYSSDVTMEDIPRIIKEHRDLRRALHKSVEILNKMGYNPDDPRSEYEWNKVVELRKKLII